MHYQEVIIIGAPRSGTNMLRNVLTTLPGFGTWPCDEINYIWRHGNSRWPSDELPPGLATKEVKAYLNRQFARRARVDSLSYVVEKTCASSLRVPFVDRVLPNARYVFIYRDAVDAVASAMKRWQARFDLMYTLRKARFVPWGDIPYYGWRLVKNRLHRLRSGQRRLAFWGPQLNGMQELLERHPLHEVCSVQWSCCVELAANALKRMPQKKVQVVRYEDFVERPAAGLGAICRFLEVEIDKLSIQQAVQAVADHSIGKGKRDLDRSLQQRIAELTAAGLDAVNGLVA